MVREIAILGGGPAGTKLAQELRIMGFEGKIYLFEDRFLGGECTNVGCIPSKTVYNFAKLVYKTKKMLGQRLDISPSIIVDSVKRVVSTIRKGIEYNLKKYDVEIIDKKAFIDNGYVIFDSGKLKPDSIALAVGSYPINFWNNSDRVLTNRELWGQYFEDFVNSLSKGIKVLVVGGGYIGLEAASMFATIFPNSHFVLIEKEKTIIPNADGDVVSEIHRSFSKNNPNIKIISSCQIKNLVQEKEVVTVDYLIGNNEVREFFDFVLISIGRKPNINGFKVDDFLRVNGSDSVWALGDVNGGKMLAHKAEFQAKIVANNILHGPKVRYTSTNELQIPSVMFTIPEAGWYGLTEDEVRKIGLQYYVKRANLSGNPRAIVDFSRDGFVKIIYNIRGEILGVHIVSDSVSELINIPMVYNSETIVYPHPTLSEVFNEIL